jgi:hypothetical protein
MMPALDFPAFDPEFAGPAQWAAMYRACGFQVVPAYMPKPNTQWKRPQLANWTHYQEELAPDATFERWYGPGGQYEKHKNLGVITGRASGDLVVIDLDTHTREEARLWWEGQLVVNAYGDEPETWKQRTGGGGRQIFFRAPIGWQAPTNKTPLGVDIRGQGGFAMLPPSLHISGREYEWEPGAAPWNVELAVAPGWLLVAVDALVEQHGGHQPGEAEGSPERTTSPSNDFDAFWNRIDGREDAMRDRVWRAVLEFKRASGEPGTQAEKDAFEVALMQYLRHTRTRIPGVDNVVGLERECRGPKAFLAKWRRAMRQWDGKIAAEAAKPNPKASPAPNPEAQQKSKAGGLILSAVEFVSAFTPPNYVIDGMVQRGYLYSLTARTGHGKTAVTTYLSQAVARGLAIAGRQVERGAVLFLAGENPDDLRARFLVLAETFQFDLGNVPIHFIAGIVDIASELPRVREEAKRIPDLMLTVVDTAAAYFRGDDANSNAQMGEYARLLRQLTFLPGKPAVVVNAHPIKNANADNLLPMGGSAFLNEVDGNLTLWSGVEHQTTLHWQGKFRGPEFEPMTFGLHVKTSARVHDSDGRLMPSIVAEPMSEMQIEAGEKVQESEENILLAVIGMNKGASIAAFARKAKFVGPNGQPQKSKVFRLCDRLRKDKLIKAVLGKYSITAEGKKHLGWTDNDAAFG